MEEAERIREISGLREERPCSGEKGTWWILLSWYSERGDRGEWQLRCCSHVGMCNWVCVVRVKSVHLQEAAGSSADELGEVSVSAARPSVCGKDQSLHATWVLGSHFVPSQLLRELESKSQDQLLLMIMLIPKAPNMHDSRLSSSAAFLACWLSILHAALPQTSIILMVIRSSCHTASFTKPVSRSDQTWARDHHLVQKMGAHPLMYTDKQLLAPGRLLYV